MRSSDPPHANPPPAGDEELSDVPLGRWRSLLDDLAAFPQHVRERGKRYAAEGRVGPVVASDREIAAIVTGTQPYRTCWTWEKDLWLPDCTCRAAPYCKHAYALGCAAIDRVRAEGSFFDPRIARLLPPSIPEAPAGPTALPVAASARPVPPRTGPPPRSAAPAPRAPREPAEIRALMRAPTTWERARLLGLMLQGRREPVDLYGPRFTTLLGEPDPEILCWRLAQELPRGLGGWLPPALEPFRDRADLAERYAAREQPQLEAELLRWAAERRETPQRSLRVVLGLAHGPRGDIVLHREVRVSSPRIQDEPRTLHQLTQLQNELRRKPWLLRAEQAALLDAVLASSWSGGDREGAAPGALARLLRRVGRTPLVTWSEALDEELARRAGVRPGDPVRIAAELLRIEPVAVERAGDPVIELQLVWPDGRRRALERVLYFRGRDAYGEAGPGLALADGEFLELLEEPSLELVERLRAGGLPVRAALRERMLGQLAEAFPGMRESLAGHVRHDAAIPAVTLDLRENDWLQIRLFARTDRAGRPDAAWTQGAAGFEYGPERRWQRLAPAPRRGEEPERLEPVPGAAGTEQEPAAETAVPARPGTGKARAATSESGAGSSPSAGGEGPAPPGTWLEAPDPDRVAPAIEWLDATGARRGDARASGGVGPLAADAQLGWWVRLTPRTAERLAEAWERRPAGVDWFGNEAIRKLLGPAARARPRVHVKASGMDWFQVSAEWEAEGQALTEEDLARLRAAPTRWVKLAGGWARRESAGIQDRAAAALADLGIEPGAGDQRVTLWQLAAARPESLAALESLGADPGAMRAIERMRERVAAYAGIPRVPVPQGFAGELRPYQRDGLDFLAWTASLGLGAILADDMGLGKTIQALAWILRLRDGDRGLGPCLVVCPTSVMHNWEREAHRFAPGLSVLLLASGRERHALRRTVSQHALVITNYALLRRDLEAWRVARLGAAILDEAQNIKNPDTAIARAVLELDARHRLALTGTPLENRALDLWSLMNFVNPGYLGGRTRFAERYDRPDAPPWLRALLAAKLRPVLLRRLKRDVAADLPERIEERRDCPLTRGQRELYLDELRRGREQILAMAADPAALRRHKLSILVALTRMRQICCHPALAGGAPSLGSGKFDALFELLEPLLAEGHKVLVFSQFVECLKLLAAEMVRRGVPWHMLTGQTTRRAEVVEAFQRDVRACVFLISLRAGGTGLNLTAASYVVLFDPWWNPAVEAQAIDRTHRIGQDRTVIAYRMLAEGTIEERIWELQQKKAALVKDVLGEEGFGRALSRDDLEYLLAEV